MATYKTAELAQRFGIHSNTVRLYEKLGLIPKPDRAANGYRVFNDLHIKQLQLVRTALEVEVLQNGLRKQAIAIIKTSATRDFDHAIYQTECYYEQIKREQKNAEEAIFITQRLLSGEDRVRNDTQLTRKEVADLLDITIDVLRNWEMNGLLIVKRRLNGYRVYTGEDIRRLKVIRSLRCANYSLAAILRLLNALSSDPETDIRQAIDTPEQHDNIISVCDKLLTSLHSAEKNAQSMLTCLKEMKQTFAANPTL